MDILDLNSCALFSKIEYKFSTVSESNPTEENNHSSSHKLSAKDISLV